MSFQRSDTVYFGSERFTTQEYPFDQYIPQIPKGEMFRIELNSGNYKGYMAEWKIDDNKLYLTKLTIPKVLEYVEETHLFKVVEQKYSMEYYFPNQKRVLADWFSGKTRLLSGERIINENNLYEDIRRNELVFDFENGVATMFTIINNKPEGRKVSAKFKIEGLNMTKLPSTDYPEYEIWYDPFGYKIENKKNENIFKKMLKKISGIG